MPAERSNKRPWRTNIGLRMSAEDGAWLVAYCEQENRTMANFVELLIKHAREASRSDGGGALVGETDNPRQPVRPDLALGACQVAAKAPDLITAQAFAQTAVDFLTGDYEPLEDS